MNSVEYKGSETCRHHVTWCRMRDRLGDQHLQSVQHTNQAAITALFRVINRYVGNLQPMAGVFPDYPAPVIRNTELAGVGDDALCRAQPRLRRTATETRQAKLACRSHPHHSPAAANASTIVRFCHSSFIGSCLVCLLPSTPLFVAPPSGRVRFSSKRTGARLTKSERRE